MNKDTTIKSRFNVADMIVSIADEGGRGRRSLPSHELHFHLLHLARREESIPSLIIDEIAVIKSRKQRGKDNNNQKTNKKQTKGMKCKNT